MKKPNKSLLKITLMILMLLTSLVPALAKDKEFDEIVKFIEKTYHAKKTSIPMLGLANFVIKIAHPKGVKNLKLAVFEDQKLTVANGGEDFDLAVRNALSQKWQPLIKVFSRKNHEWTYIYAKEEDKDTKLLVVNLDQHEAVVVQAKVNLETLASWLEKPDSINKTLKNFGFSDKNNKDDGKDNNTFGDGFGEEIAQALHIADKEKPDSSKPVANTSENISVEPVSLKRSTEPPTLKTTETALVTAPTTTLPENKTPISETLNKSTANEDESLVKVESKLVMLNASVSNTKGQAIANLGKDDFSIYEEGVKQEISHYQSIKAPLNIVLLLDLSGSVNKKLKLISKAAERFVQASRPDDKIAIVTFTSRTKIISPLTSDHELLRSRIKNIHHPEGGTKFYDAMEETIKSVLAIRRNERNVIVLFSDGVDNALPEVPGEGSKTSFEDMLRDIEESNTVVFPIYLDTEKEAVHDFGDAMSPAYKLARKQLTELAEDTGGEMFYAKDIKDLENRYDQVITEMSNIYSLGYYPSSSEVKSNFHKIQVRTNQGDTHIRTRRGYYTSSSLSTSAFTN